MERRLAAEQRLLRSLPRSARAKARVILRLGRALIPLRESGKASFLRATDGARCAARVLGAELASRAFLSDPEDVFFLTYAELLTGVEEPMHAVVQARREDHARFERLEVPQAWTGNPSATERVPAEPAPVAEAVHRLDGIGVFGAEVSGRARVALDPANVDLQPGEVLVCRTTDPSWTPLFLIAEALVIDTGGAMSHGAIVARELGVPCVINTRTGTRDIPDGAWVTLNGTTGEITIQRDPQAS